MALSFVKKSPVATSPAKKPSSGSAWFKRGNDAHEEFEKEEKRIEERQKNNGKMRRFYLTDGEEGRITFVDGNLLPNGILDALSYREHLLNVMGQWTHFVCTHLTEPCPICEGGDNPSLVAVFTVIDHREIKSKDGTKVYKDQPKLYVAKRNTFKILQQKALKHGGLAGCTFDVLRTGDTSPNVGNHFDFVEKHEVPVLKKHFSYKDEKGNLVTKFTPANYEEEIVYRTAKELRAMGFGSKSIIGSEPALADTTAADPDVADQL